MMDDPNIHVEDFYKIAPSAIVASKYGGKISIGKNTLIWENAILMTYGGNIKIGSSCIINPFSIIYGHGGTSIGNNVLIAAHCMIVPSNHNYAETSIPITEQGNTSKGIRIEDDVWIAHGCSILDGVTIGKGAIIGAGSVVNKDIPAYSIAAGVPARVIKSRLD